MLHLERTNTSLRHEVEKEAKQRKQLSEEVNNKPEIINQKYFSLLYN